MDVSLTGGLPMTLIGIGTVFSALVSLVIVVMLMTRIAARRQGVQPIPSEAEAEQIDSGVSPQASDQPPDLLRVALAAYSFHRQRQASVSSPTPASAWSSAGRLRQTAPFRGR